MLVELQPKAGQYAVVHESGTVSDNGQHTRPAGHDFANRRTNSDRSVMTAIHSHKAHPLDAPGFLGGKVLDLEDHSRFAFALEDRGINFGIRIFARNVVKDCERGLRNRPRREQGSQGVVLGGLLFAVAFVLFHQGVVLRECINQRGVHRRVALPVLEHVDLLVEDWCPVVVFLRPRWPHKERDLRSIRQGHDQRKAVIAVEIPDGLQDDLVVDHREWFESTFPAEHLRLARVDGLLEAQRRDDLPLHVDGVGPVLRMLGEQDGPPIVIGGLRTQRR
ncbi:hypothetical protein MXAN_4324 [Myxococcus xanthus DK 1622]|uniref:Uncharacterized protein n=1 Tax=Myxococcus xanthus (strain DK1622) TaxID=246197 RepID=Q1D4C3_MYXXD|nr:hypothetical protein MXAN_4324 [Myxococcus xanthus DK 1622]